MTQRSKLIERFLSKPRDFTWREMTSLLKTFGYSIGKSGKTGGSRVRFVHPEKPAVILHKPHPLPVMKKYQLQQVEEILKKEGLL